MIRGKIDIHINLQVFLIHKIPHIEENSSKQQVKWWKQETETDPSEAGIPNFNSFEGVLAGDRIKERALVPIFLAMSSKWASLPVLISERAWLKLKGRTSISCSWISELFRTPTLPPTPPSLKCLPTHLFKTPRMVVLYFLGLLGTLPVIQDYHPPSLIYPL